MSGTDRSRRPGKSCQRVCQPVVARVRRSSHRRSTWSARSSMPRVVVQDDVGNGESRRSARLCRDPGVGGLGIESAALLQALELALGIDIDDDEHVVVGLLSGLHQQRDHVHDHGVGVRVRLDGGGPRPYGGMDDALPDRVGTRVGEDELPSASRFRRPSALSTSGTEALHHRGETRRAGFDHLSRQHVGVDDHRPALASASETAVFPDAIPPVSPTRSTTAPTVRGRASRDGQPPRSRTTPVRRSVRGPSGRSDERGDQAPPPVSFSRRACRASSEASEPSGTAARR